MLQDEKVSTVINVAMECLLVIRLFLFLSIRMLFGRCSNLTANGWYMLSGRISESVPVRRTRNCDARIHSWRTTEPRPAICTLLGAGIISFLSLLVYFLCLYTRLSFSILYLVSSIVVYFLKHILEMLQFLNQRINPLSQIRTKV